MPTGTTGDDHLVGTGGPDVFDLTLGGNDYAAGKGGADTFQIGATFAKGDRLYGGDGMDTLSLDGDYSAGLTFKAKMLHDIENLSLAAGHSYKLTTNDANVGAGLSLIVDASALLASDALIFNGSADLDGRFGITAGAGNDILTGGAGNDIFDLSHGGSDRAYGGAGDNNFILGAAFDPTDRIDGGNPTGNTNVFLNGDYNIVLQTNTMKNISNLSLQGAHDYRIVFNNGNVAAGAAQFVNSYNVSAGHTVEIDGSAETDGRFFMSGGASDDILTGGDMGDHFTLPFAGDDTIKGGAGDDEIVFTDVLTGADRVNGGGGFDTLTLEGDFSGGRVFDAHTLSAIERIVVDDGFSYSLTTADGNVAAGQTLTVDAALLTGTNTLNWDGSKETDGRYVVTGGAGDDIIRGGAGNDALHGGDGLDRIKGDLGADTLDGAGGIDVYIYAAVAESTGAGYDTITDFHSADAFDLPVTVSRFDTHVVSGALSPASFDADLTDALDGVNPSNPADDLLKAHHAVLFTPDQGAYNGETYLVVDANGASGYQAGEDYVIRVTGYTDAPTVSNFI